MHNSLEMKGICRIFLHFVLLDGFRGLGDARLIKGLDGRA